MRQIALWLKEAVRDTGLVLAVVVGVLFFAVVAIAMRPLLILVALAALAVSLVLYRFRPGFREWFDASGEEQISYNGLHLATDVAVHPNHSWRGSAAKKRWWASTTWSSPPWVRCRRWNCRRSAAASSKGTACSACGAVRGASRSGLPCRGRSSPRTRPCVSIPAWSMTILSSGLGREDQGGRTAESRGALLRGARREAGSARRSTAC